VGFAGDPSPVSERLPFLPVARVRSALFAPGMQATHAEKLA